MGTISLPTIDETRQLAEEIATLLKVKDVILLEGDLGSGKTELTRFIIQALCGHKTQVLSPSFMLVQQYDCPSFPLWHYDLYRLENPVEVFELGIEDTYTQGVTLIEWPERLAHWRPQEYLNIKLSLDLKNHGRTATITATPLWFKRLDH